jgi:hypothetical protein
MEDALYKATEELKRIDHLIYVSLKYTRTVDVIRHCIERIISAYNYLFEIVLMHIKEDGNIDEIPVQPLMRAKKIELYFDDAHVHEHVAFYRKLRKVYAAEYDKRSEFRRHVTMTAHMADGTDVEVNLDIIQEYYKMVKEFKDYLCEHFSIAEDHESFLNKDSF